MPSKNSGLHGHTSQRQAHRYYADSIENAWVQKRDFGGFQEVIDSGELSQFWINRSLAMDESGDG
ncbi:hypothetical protein OAF09_01350 [bacterium]|nr:hypothetical protein [bacterium]